MSSSGYTKNKLNLTNIVQVSNYESWRTYLADWEIFLLFDISCSQHWYMEAMATNLITLCIYSLNSINVVINSYYLNIINYSKIYLIQIRLTILPITIYTCTDLKYLNFYLLYSMYVNLISFKCHVLAICIMLWWVRKCILPSISDFSLLALFGAP